MIADQLAAVEAQVAELVGIIADRDWATARAQITRLLVAVRTLELAIAESGLAQQSQAALTRIKQGLEEIDRALTMH